MTVLVLFSLTLLTATPINGQAITNSGNTHSVGDRIVEIVDDREVLHEISEEPSLEGADWPIVFSEIVEKTDDETGEVYIEKTEIRRLVIKDTLKDKDCPNEERILSNCYYDGSILVARESQSGNITAHIRHYSDVYCIPYDCTIYRPYKVERWWTRTSTSYHVTNARLSWGCGACALCDGGNWTYVYHSDPMSPGWNNLTSWTYTTHISWFEPMQALWYGGRPDALSNSDQVSVSAPLP